MSGEEAVVGETGTGLGACWRSWQGRDGRTRLLDCLSLARSLLVDGSSAWLCAEEEVMFYSRISVPSLSGCTPLIPFSWS